MKILVLASYAKSLTVFRGSLIQEFVARGHEVIACAPDLDAETERDLLALGAVARSTPMHRAGTNAFADLAYCMVLRRLIRELSPDRVLAYTMKPVIYGSLSAGRRVHSVSLITGLGYAFAQGNLRQRFVGSVVRFLLSQALARNTMVIFQNTDDRDEFLERGLVRASAATTVVNGSGVDTTHYALSRITNTRTFLMIARLLEDKGVCEYAEAARIVKAQVPDAQFNLVGWFDENPRCIGHEELDAWVNEGTINFLGRLDDVRPAISECTVYVLPSHREGMPRTSLEAMSMGRAIITTDVPGCRETVVAGRNGLLVPVRDAGELAGAMMRFLRGECSASDMGQKSRWIAENKFDVRKVNLQMIEALDL